MEHHQYPHQHQHHQLQQQQHRNQRTVISSSVAPLPCGSSDHTNECNVQSSRSWRRACTVCTTASLAEKSSSKKVLPRNVLCSPPRVSTNRPRQAKESLYQYPYVPVTVLSAVREEEEEEEEKKEEHIETGSFARRPLTATVVANVSTPLSPSSCPAGFHHQVHRVPHARSTHAGNGNGNGNGNVHRTSSRPGAHMLTTVSNTSGSSRRISVKTLLPTRILVLAYVVTFFICFSISLQTVLQMRQPFVFFHTTVHNTTSSATKEFHPLSKVSNGLQRSDFEKIPVNGAAKGPNNPERILETKGAPPPSKAMNNHRLRNGNMDQTKQTIQHNQNQRRATRMQNLNHQQQQPVHQGKKPKQAKKGPEFVHARRARHSTPLLYTPPQTETSNEPPPPILTPPTPAPAPVSVTSAFVGLTAVIFMTSYIFMIGSREARRRWIEVQSRWPSQQQHSLQLQHVQRLASLYGQGASLRRHGGSQHPHQLHPQQHQQQRVRMQAGQQRWQVQAQHEQ